MPACTLDHLTLAAPTLAAGAVYVQEILGVAPQTGGEHPRMGTHNLLLRLGDTMFLEVIAPNPAAPAPTRPRWFGLDRLAATTPPRLAAWVVRSADIHSTLAGSAARLGAIEPMSRGRFDWLITVPEDGSLPLGGAAPILIQWHGERHPAAGLPDVGLSLVNLEIFHPDSECIERLLSSLAVAGNIQVSPSAPGQTPSLRAIIDTPSGRRILSTPTPARQA